MTTNVIRTTEELSYNIKIARKITARAVGVHVERKKGIPSSENRCIISQKFSVNLRKTKSKLMFDSGQTLL